MEQREKSKRNPSLCTIMNRPPLLSHHGALVSDVEPDEVTAENVHILLFALHSLLHEVGRGLLGLRGVPSQTFVGELK